MIRRIKELDITKEDLREFAEDLFGFFCLGLIALMLAGIPV